MRDPRSRSNEPPATAVCANELEYFRSYYEASGGDTDDRRTIGTVTELEARFHYAAVEMSILRALAAIEPPPPAPLVAGYRMMKEREAARLLDVGTGAGHWIDFMMQVLHVKEAVGLEFVTSLREELGRKYAGRPVTILDLDIGEPGFSPEAIGGPVSYVTAIGVMFHILDDERWRRGVAHVSMALRSGGLAFFGGDFGVQTENREAARSDRFSTWNEYRSTGAEASVVTKRVRSLSLWAETLDAAGLTLVDLRRSESDPRISTPENDVLVARRR